MSPSYCFELDKNKKWCALRGVSSKKGLGGVSGYQEGSGEGHACSLKTGKAALYKSWSEVSRLDTCAQSYVLQLCLIITQECDSEGWEM